MTNQKHTSYFHIISKYMISFQGLGVDKNFSSKELADISAFTALIEEKLLPAYVSCLCFFNEVL